ncbi:MAG: glycosyltransferase family 2 protein [Candidatus Woesearchaeota archaeon]
MDMIMAFSVIPFSVLFLFLLFGAITVVISAYKKEEYPDIEPEVSVVIPAYNEEKNIQMTLDSIFNLDYPQEKIELIVVDDGSTDKTGMILRSYAKHHKNMQVIKGKHEGKSESLNLGINKAKNEIVMTLDADTIIRKDSMRKIIKPFSRDNVGSTNGTCTIKNPGTILSVFQRVEYHSNNLMRKGFSSVFSNGIWFFGAMACYRKSILERIGYFKKDTQAEDFDTALEMYSLGYNTINVPDAYGKTVVPETFKELANQRKRWWIGVIQALSKHKHLFHWKANPSILFLFINHYWWSFYAIISLPLIAYQVYYWLPYNTGSFYSVFMYLFRWFSMVGPVYVIYMIPQWGISAFSIFGVISGLISSGLMVYAIYFFGDRLRIRNLFAIFFYFPYTIILNTIIIISVLRIMKVNKRYFID